MALTRISNNQITDATIVASSKLQDNSISAGKLANNLNYGSNLTITGNLTVNGTSTTLDTVNTLIEDPILLLAKDQTGAAALDIGFVGERGDDTNIAWIWDEASSQFAAGFTSSDGSANTITLSSYADARVADITMVNLAPSGNVTTALNASSTIEAGTSITAGTTVTATGNVSGGNLTTAGQVAGDNADITNGITAGTTITATGNVSGGNLTTGGAVEATGLISSGSTITATGNVAGGNITTGGAVEATGLISSGSTITATGNITGGNLVTAGAITDGTATLSSGSITGGVAATFSGAVEGGSITDGTATISSGAITGATSGSFSTTLTATGNITGGNINTAGQVVATGNITGGNLITAGTFQAASITATGNVTGGNLVTAGSITDGVLTIDNGSITGGDAATFANTITGGSLTDGTATISSGAITGATSGTFSGTVTGGTLTDGTASISSGAITGATNITGSGTITGGTLTDGTASINSGAITGATSGTFSGTVTGGTLTDGTASISSGAITGATTGSFSGNVTTGNVSGTTGAFTNVGGTLTTASQTNITAVGTLGSLNVTGNVDSGNVNTTLVDATTLTASGTVTGGTVTDGTLSINSGAITGATSGSFSSTLTATGNVTGGNVNTAGIVAATGNVSGGNLTTGGDIDASGDISGLTITSSTFQGATPTIQSTGTNADIILNPNGTGDVDVSGAKIIQLATPTADGDAANKSYVDSVAEGLDIKGSCVAATTGALPAVTYDNGASGVGATLTADANGALAAQDGVTLVADERLLVKDQASALQNGIYVVTTVGDAGTAFVLTRATDFDQGSPSGEIPGGFTFIEEGSTNADAGFVCTTNAPVTMGSTAVNFTQFSGAGGITAGDGLSKTGDTLDVNVDDVTTAIVGDAVVVKTSANLTTPNIGVANGDSLTVTGNVDGVSSNFSGVIVATGNVTGGNLVTAGSITDGTLTIDSGSITGGDAATFANTITGGTLTDGTLSINSGAITGATSGSFSTTLTATGNITGGNLTTGGQLNVTGNVTGGNLVTAGAITDGVFTADNGVFTGVVSIDASGNVDSGNVNTTLVDATTLTASGTVTGGTLTDGTLSSTSGTITGGVAATFSGAVSGGSITDGTATLSSGSITGGVAATFSGAVSGGSITDGTATLSSGSITGGVAATFSGAVQGGSLTDGTATISSGAITGATSGSFSTTLTATGNITGGNLVTAGQLAADNIAATNGITAGTTIVATGNVSGGNVTTAGQVQADNVDATNGITAGTTVVATGNVSGGNLTTAGQIAGDNADITNGITAGTTITATGNVAGGNLTTAGQIAGDNADITNGITAGTTITATGNVAGGNLTTAGQVAADNADITNGITAGTTITATGNVAGGNITTGGRVDATGAVTGASVTAGNVTINTDSIDSAGTAITLNTDSSDVDIVIENSAGNAYVKADAGTSAVVIGENGTQTTGVTFKVEATNSQMIPVGTTAQRPTGVTGMIRFNTTLDQFEFYDSNSWTTAGSDFTVIASETFSGDNSTTAFTLGSTQTTASCIVSINGVVQEPTAAYAVSGTTLTFTEAPLAGDTIEVREITTTSTILGLASDDTTSSVTTEDGGDVAIKGNIIPSANVTYDLGSTSERWKDLYLSGTSITLGNVVIKNTGGNAVGFFGPDGTTPGVIDANVEIAGDSIVNGTSSVDFSGTNGDVRLTAGGTQSLTVISTGANVVGDFATTGDVRFLDGDNSNYVGFQAPTTVSSDLVWTLPSADAGVSGYALVSDGAGTLSFAAAGATVSSDTSTNTDFLLYFASTTTGALTAVKQDSGLIYNPSTGLLTSASFSGDGSALTALNGSQVTTGTIAAARVATLNQDTTGTAAIATTITVADESTDTTCFPLFATAATGDLGAKSGSNLTFNSSTGVLAATTFSGSGASLTALNGSNISTGTIAAARVATLNQNTTGTAGGLSSAVTVSLTGDVTGSATFTSAGDTASITTTIAANSVALGTDTTGNYVGTITGGTGIASSGATTGEGVAHTLSVDLSELTDMTGGMVGTDEFIVLDAGADRRKAANEIGLSIFSNDAGFTTNVGDITGVTAGVGLSGGGSSGSVTLTVDLSELTDMTGGMVGTDEFIVLDAGADRRKAANEIGLSIFSNDAGFTTNVGDITNVAVSGTGLSGGGASGSVTISSNATSANTGSTIVARDVSGNFSAGVITATATQARYADLAEMYAADGDIEAGTVVHFAGEGKLAACDQANHHAVAGIVSTDPAYLMNTDQEGVALAISGRVPCKVTGVVNAGDLMVSAGNGRAMANNSPAIGTVIGKAIESNAGGEAVIEVLAMMM